MSGNIGREASSKTKSIVGHEANRLAKLGWNNRVLRWDKDHYQYGHP
jgi:hypothetical protein